MSKGSAQPVFYAYLDTVETPIRANRWFAQLGGRWMAVTPNESEEEWFADCDPAELPTPRVQPIEDIPTTGTLTYMRADFTPVECDAATFAQQGAVTTSKGPEHVAADKDHSPVTVGEDPTNCEKCGLAVTWDGKEHGFTD